MRRHHTRRNLGLKKIGGEIVNFGNREKEDHETWFKTIYYVGKKKYIKNGVANPANFPAPFRLINQAPPNKGKTNVVLNIIAAQKPYFEKIFVSHPDFNTSEYDLIDYTAIRGIPSPNNEIFRNDLKKLWIIDDCEMKRRLNKEEKSKLDKIFSYVSTHHNLSIIITSQNIEEQIFKAIPKYCDIFIFGKEQSRYKIESISAKLGLPYKCIKRFFTEYCDDNFDNICFDNTRGTPYPIRKNLYQIVDPDEFYALDY